MTDTLWRMLWALPLVLVLGVVAIIAIKRTLDRMGVSSARAEPMTLRQSLKLSDGVQAHLLAVDGQSVLVVESSTGPVVQVLPTTAPARVWPGVIRNPRA